VALSGMGGDELFGGYASFTDVRGSLRGAAACAGRGRRAGCCGRRCPGMNGRGGAKAAEMLTRQASPVTLYLLRASCSCRPNAAICWRLPPESDAVTGMPQVAVDELTQLTRGLEGSISSRR